MRKISLFIVLLLLVQQLFSQQIYVDPVSGNDSNDGQTWSSAVKSIQTGISKLQTGSTNLWIKSGNIDITTSIILNKNISIYGGFEGFETNISQRKFINKTIIQSTLQTGIFKINTAGFSYLIDGIDFLFSNSTAIDLNSATTGATLLTIRNASFTNWGTTNSNNPTSINVNAPQASITTKIENCKFADFKIWATAGSVVNIQNGSTTISDCEFRNNSISGFSTTKGIALKASGSSLTVKNSVFDTNSTSGDGGALYSDCNSNILENIKFIGNSSTTGSGGAAYFFGGSVDLYNCLFAVNSGFKNGGACYFSGIANANIYNCTIAFNSTSSLISGFMSDNSTVQIYNSIFYNCSPYGLGYQNSTISHTSTVFFNADSFLIGTGSNFTGVPFVCSDPLFVNWSYNDYNLKQNSPCINSGTASYILSTTDLAGNPRILDGQIDIGAYEALPAFTTNSANTYYITPYAKGDVSGDSWANARPDLYNVLSLIQAPSTVYVAGGTYFPAEGDRLNSFSLADGVNIYGGFTGNETITYISSRTQFGKGEINETILDGNIGDPSSASDNVYHVVKTYSTTGKNKIDGFTITNGNANGDGDNTNGGGINTLGGIIENCNIINNNSIGNGAGIYLVLSNNLTNTIKIYKNTISNNISGDKAGGFGIFAKYSIQQLTIQKNIIRNNTSVNSGGGAGIYCETNGLINNSIIQDNEFINNSSKIGGALIMTNFSGSITSTISGNLFANNKAIANNGNAGAALMTLSQGVGAANFTIYNNIFTNNESSTAMGGAISSGNLGSNPVNLKIFNNTICNNKATEGASIRFSGTSGNTPVVDISNNIFWNNTNYTGTNLKEISFEYAGNVSLTNNALYDYSNSVYFTSGTTVTFSGNIDLLSNTNGDVAFFNPIFTAGYIHDKNEWLPSDWSINDNSILKDVGNTSLYTGLETDFSGKHRVVNSGIDIGAFENQKWDGAGNALSFDGINDYVKLDSLIILGKSNAFTIECWVKPVNNALTGSILKVIDNSNAIGKSLAIETNSSINSSNQISLQPGATLFYLRGSGDDTNVLGAYITTNIYDNNWHHIAWSVSDASANQHKIYIDGVEVSPVDSYSGSPTMDADFDLPIFLGAEDENNIAKSFYSGEIDELRVWTSARTGSEILANMHQSYIGQDANLIGNYNFNMASGTNLPCSTNINRIGILKNMEDEDWVPSQAMLTPFIRKFTALDDHTISILWDSIPNAEEYIVNVSYEKYFQITLYNSTQNHIGDTITGLEFDTKYYFQVISKKDNIYSNPALDSFLIPHTYDVYDIEGNGYDTVKIGTQTWFSSNLKTTKYNDNSQIFYPLTATEWTSNTTGAYSWYNDDIAYKKTWGALYNWYAVDTASNDNHKLCPDGWHVPGDSEWTILENYLIDNGYNYDGSTTGNKLAKSVASKDGWVNSTTIGRPGNNPNTNNTSGFDGKPSLSRNSNGDFPTNIGENAYWWTSTNMYHRYIEYFGVAIGRNQQTNVGMSVRCLKDLDLQVSITTPKTLICDGESAVLTANVSGNAPFTYLWNNAGNSTTQTISVSSSGTYSVTVTDAKGVSKTSEIAIDVYSFSYTISPSAEYCSGDVIDPIVISFTPANNDYNFGYIHDQTEYPYMTATNGVFTISTPESGLYHLSGVITDVNYGCSIMANQELFTEISIYDPPTISADITDVACFGQESGSIYIIFSGDTGPLTYVWNSGETSHLITEKSAGNYSVTVTDNMSTCSSTYAYTINQPDQTTVYAGADSSICIGIPVSLNGIATNFNTVTWTTYTGSGIIDNSNITSPTFTSIYSGTNVLVITAQPTAVGCASVTDTIEITVNENPTVAISGETTVCQGFDLPLSSQVTGGIGTYTYTWSDNEENILSNYNSSSTVLSTNITGEHVVALKVTDSNGCIDSATKVSGILPVTSFTITPDRTGACESGANSEIIKFSGIPANGTTTFSVDNGGIINPTTGDFDPKLNDPEHYTVTCNYTNTSGCISTATTEIDVYPIPYVTIEYPASSLCENDDPIAPQVTPLSGTFSSSPSTTGLNTTTGVFSPSISGPNTYNITYDHTDVNGCNASKSAVIEVNARPVIAPLALPPSICDDEEGISLTASPDGVTFSGVGVTNGIFNPATSGSGSFNILYNYIDTITNCAAQTKINTITVYHTDPPVTTNVNALNTDVNSQIEVPELTATGTAIKWYLTNIKTTTPYRNTPNASPLFIDTDSDGTMDFGSYSLWATQTVNGCESQPAEAILTISNCNIQAPNASDVSICEGESLPVLSAEPTATIVKWYDATRALVGNSKDLSLADLPTNFISGVYTFYITQEALNQSGDLCVSPEKEVVFTITPSPVFSLSFSKESPYCYNDELIEITPTGSTLESIVYSVNGKETIITTSGLTGQLLLSHPDLSSVESFYADITATGTDASGCTYTSVKQISVTHVFPPVAESVSAIFGSAVKPLDAIGSNIKWYSNANELLAENQTYIPEIPASGMYTFKVTQTINGCESDPTMVTYTSVDTCEIPMPIVSNYEMCIGDENPVLSASGLYEFEWYSDNELTNSLSLSNTYTPEITNAGIYTYFVVQKFNACTSPASTVKLIAYPKPLISISGPSTVSIISGTAQFTAIPAGGMFFGDYINNQGKLDVSNATPGTTEISYDYTNPNTGCNAYKNLSISIVDELIPVTGITIVEDAVSLAVSERKMLTTVVLPIGASDKTVIWTSADPAIATVNGGLVTGKSIGTTTITGTTKDGSFSDVVTITVIESTKLLSVSVPQNLNIVLNDSVTVIPVLNPANAVISSMLWTSTNTNIATVTDGKIYAVGKGMTQIIVVANNSVSAVINVNVTETFIPITSIVLPERIQLKIGEKELIPMLIQPQNASNKVLTWTIDDPSIIEISPEGIINGLQEGSTTIYATSFSGTISNTCTVVISGSDAPVISYIPHIIVSGGESSTTIDLSKYIYDDDEPFSGLLVSVVGSDKIIPELDAATGILKITNAFPALEFTDTLILTVSDHDGMVSQAYIFASFTKETNEAPVVVIPDINVESANAQVTLNINDYVSDDNTLTEDITWYVSGGDNVSVIKNTDGTVTISPYDSQWTGTDTITFTATDASGATTEISITYSVISQITSNIAPVIKTFPVLINSATSSFTPVNLNMYVSDDNTLPQDIVWYFEPSSKLAISSINNVAFFTIIDANWTGETTVKFYAEDNQGLRDSILVRFIQETETGTNWYALPEIDFSADKVSIISGETIRFSASLVGADSWKWMFDGASVTQSSASSPEITYNKPGMFKVSLLAQNDYGIDSLVKVAYIKVAGIVQDDLILCKGADTTLTATGTGYTFKWSTGATTSTITVSPNVTTTYTVTITKGLFEQTDDITVTIPAVVSLQQDTAICVGTNILVDAGSFETYSWSDGTSIIGNQQVIALSKVGSYSVEVEDQNNCISRDTVSITTLYPLPDFTLGDDKKICEGTNITFDAGIDGSYLWNTLETTKTITVSEDGEYIVTVTDANSCQNSDTINLTILRPYQELLGVVTFSKESGFVIVAWERTAGMRTAKYNVYREIGALDQYELIGSRNFNDTSFVWDKDANVTTKSYKYKLGTVDSTCANEALSPIHKTMHLQTGLDLDNHATLKWEQYEGLVFSSYLIYKSNSQGTFDEVDQVASDRTSWTDPSEYVKGTKYRVGIDLPYEVNPMLLKSDSGPFSQSMSNITEAELTSVKNIKNTDHVDIYPVPVKELLHVTGKDIVSIQLLDILGNIILTTENTEIDMREYSSGVYIVRINTINNIYERHFLKQ